MTARQIVVAILIALFAIALYVIDVGHNPPGFYIDESSIAYNAHTIAQNGRDEYGERFPLYFRAFGDYKNPTLIYLLSAVFRITGPSIRVARLICALLGASTALLIGWLALRITRDAPVAASQSRRGEVAGGGSPIALVITISTLLTPWLYESSRTVFEVAAYPLCCALFLLAVWRASRQLRWRLSDVLAVAATLALLTYTYSIGRLLAPLLALGLAFFITRENLARVFQTWAAYALTLVPLATFASRHPLALTGRFAQLTYLSPHTTFREWTRMFARQCLANFNPWRWLVTGEHNIRDHLPDSPAVLAVTFAAAAAGIALILLRHNREPWWRFVLFGFAVSFVPASLTTTEFPQLRLIAVPVFLNVLAIPAFAIFSDTGGARLRRAGSIRGAHAPRVLTKAPSPSRTSQPSPTPDPVSARRRNEHAAARALPGIVTATIILLLAQGLHWQWRYHFHAPERWYIFDARFDRKVLAPALDAAHSATIYLEDPPGKSGYIQALWYGALRGIPPSRFHRLAANEPPPPAAVVISTREQCDECVMLVRALNHIVYATPPTNLHPISEPLPLNEHSPENSTAVSRQVFARANLSAPNLPQSLLAGETRRLEVIVRNEGAGTWPALGIHAVQLQARWLRKDGSLFVDETPVPLTFDMEPRDTAGLPITLSAPAVAGDYTVEFDLVQQGVGALRDNGSQPLRHEVKVAARQ